MFHLVDQTLKTKKKVTVGERTLRKKGKRGEER